MSRYSDLIAHLDSHLARGDWRSTLVEITNTVIALFQDPLAKAVVYGSPEIDALCLRAGKILWDADPPAPGRAFDASLNVFVATELTKGVGGHTLALKDLMTAQPTLRHVVLLTNLHNKVLEPDRIFEDLSPRPDVRVAPDGDLAIKTIWLHKQLLALAAGRLTLFNHHYDTAAIACAQPGAAASTVYFHHCDHDMALGVYLPHAKHVDCSNMMHDKCRHTLGVHNPRYWPLVAQDRGARDAARPFMADGTLTTASHGSTPKFLSSGRHAYLDLIHRRLKELGGVHLHIGGFPEPLLAQFAQRLAADDIDPTRFRHVPPVPSLWDFLGASAIDVCISSFPIQGLKGLVETMGAGLPILMQQSTLTRSHSSRDTVYEDALAWQHPDDFMAALRGVTPESLAFHSRASRRHYERWHHPRELSHALHTAEQHVEPPPMHAFQQDTLALYWR